MADRRIVWTVGIRADTFEIDKRKNAPRHVADPFAVWTVRIVLAGLFLVFLAHFGQFVVGQLWAVIGPLFRHKP